MSSIALLRLDDHAATLHWHNLLETQLHTLGVPVLARPAKAPCADGPLWVRQLQHSPALVLALQTRGSLDAGVRRRYGLTEFAVAHELVHRLHAQHLAGQPRLQFAPAGWPPDLWTLSPDVLALALPPQAHAATASLLSEALVHYYTPNTHDRELWTNSIWYC